MINLFYNILINNFFIKIHGFKYKNYIYYKNIILIPFIPIKFLLNLFNIDIIYSINDLYFITTKKNIINPIIFKFEIFDLNDNSINITKIIKNYHGMIPINFIIKTNIDKYNYATKIKFKYLFNSTLIEKELKIIKTDNNKLLSDIFN
jgi:hypothetical protein